MSAIASLLTDVGMVALDEGDYGRAGVHLAESLTLLRELGDRWLTAFALEQSGGLAVDCS